MTYLGYRFTGIVGSWHGGEEDTGELTGREVVTDGQAITQSATG